MKIKRERLIYLHHLPSMSRRYLYALRQYDPSLKATFTMSPHFLSQLLNISIKKASLLYKEIHTSPNSLSKSQDHLHIKIITIYDKHFPETLKMIPDGPLVLYAMGDTSLLQKTKSISVIGTRKPSKEAFAKLVHIVSPLIKQKWLIVSGMAYGIDGMAHDLTLRHDGATIAVLGGGFYHVYPKTHIHLFNEIVKKGLVISEYPPYQRPQKYHFPERNRIISGLTKGTLVIEAMERSGTLITVDQALEQGKEVYAVPGSPFIRETAGCHKIIQEGAKLVANFTDIVEDWNEYLS